MQRRRDQLPAVDGQVEGLPHARVGEGRPVDPQGQVEHPVAGAGVDAQRRVPPERGQLLERNLVHDLGAPASQQGQPPALVGLDHEARHLEGRRRAAIVVVAAQHEALPRAPRLEPVGPGADGPDGPRGERGARQDHPPRQLREQQRVGRPRPDHDLPVALGPHRLDGLQEVAEDPALGPVRLERGHHVRGGDRGAVRKALARPQIEDVGAGIRRLPALGHRRHQVVSAVEAGQSLEDVPVDVLGVALVGHGRVREEARHVRAHAQRQLSGSGRRLASASRRPRGESRDQDETEPPSGERAHGRHSHTRLARATVSRAAAARPRAPGTAPPAAA